MGVSWWWMWLAFMFLFVVPPLGYGWGYRGWGPPLPRYVQRRRGAQAVVTGRSSLVEHQAWGWGGDFVWAAALLGVLWVVCGAFLART